MTVFFTNNFSIKFQSKRHNNLDRINFVAINRDGDILWKHTVRFPQITNRGYRRKRAWSIIGEAIPAFSLIPLGKTIILFS